MGETIKTSFENSLESARQLDEQDELKDFRERFYLPEADGKPMLYFCGNSLGLQPKSVEKYIDQELLDWKNLGVEGHFEGKNPWFYYHHFVEETHAELVGASKEEVVAMNTLSVNLNLLMVSFYRPTKERFKIIMEAHAFPSDQYAVEMQVRFHGFDPAKAIVELSPRKGENNLRTEDILDAINEHGNQLALSMFSGVQYYTGQYFNIPVITEAAHKVGALVGFDLAHATGNLPLKLHDWNVDFAVWCSYKYLNAGPGGVSGAFVHEKHGNSQDLPRFAGWWGNDEKTRFLMEPGFVPQSGAAGWQMSNAPVMNIATLWASLEIFREAGINRLRDKSLVLTDFCEQVIRDAVGDAYTIITPSDPDQRGCQLSILTDEHGKKIFDYLAENHVIVDWREPNVIRLAPVPLYNSFEDVFRFGQALAEAQKNALAKHG